MADIMIRRATLDDASGIYNGIYREEPDDSPWSRPDECVITINHRLLQGVIVLVAEMGGSIIGHADYLIGQEPEPFGKIIHLSVIQIHSHARGRGIGRLLIANGIQLGRENGCSLLTTVPAETSKGFYARCGFCCIQENIRTTVRVDRATSEGWQPVDGVPHDVLGKLPLRIGRVQSSKEMWHIFNRGMRIAGRFEPVIFSTQNGEGTAFIQLRYWPDDIPLVASWADWNILIEELVSGAGALARCYGSTRLCCVFSPSDRASLEASGFTVVDTSSKETETWAMELNA